jgi:hypothetical protein
MVKHGNGGVYNDTTGVIGHNVQNSQYHHTSIICIFREGRAWRRLTRQSACQAQLRSVPIHEAVLHYHGDGFPN